MGRKDLTWEKTNQILDAFESCIVEYGLPNTTIEKIADRAQVNKGMIHHYIGNINHLLSALIGRLIERYRKGFSEYLETHQNNLNPNMIVEYFFDEWTGKGPNDEVLIEALVTESARDSSIQKMILEGYLTLEDELSSVLGKLYPNASEKRCRSVAYAIMTMAYGSDTMIWLGFDRSRLLAARSSSLILLKNLENEK